ncbi:MAG TPA: TolC family protein [Blastocatellia bacterium]|nr:TolC family protein [Blastocatellia bacterium]HMV85526.1 TolC family protein [Blastocatellia bacterium]HMZ19429.1 TolC family protein [Blastocatellia bacterium]HNG32396.1 TolC family protein [Blastocatellia bacterium]
MSATALLLLLPAGSLAQTGQTSSGVSKAVEVRTGHKLNPAARPGGAALPEGVALDDGLTEDEAVAVALWNNPALQADLATLGLARADVVQAGLLTNPQLTMIFPFSFRVLEAVANWPIEAIWQRPRRVAAAKLELERVEETLVVRALDLARDVRLGFADYAAAQTRAGIAEDLVRERRDIAAIVAARLRAGDISELEANAAVTEARLTEERAARFAQDALLAKERLRGLLGFAGEDVTLNLVVLPATLAPPADRVISVQASVAQPPDAFAAESEQLNELVKQALEARPELKAGELAIEAAGARAKWERSRIVNVTAIAKEYGRGTHGFEQGPGLLIDLPIFNRNQGNISRAEADIERAAKQLIAARQRVVTEVREAFTQLLLARQAHQLWRVRVLPPLEQDLRLANAAYRSGDASYLFVLETARRYSDERLRETDYLLATARALAQLERSVGRRLLATR